MSFTKAQLAVCPSASLAVCGLSFSLKKSSSWPALAFGATRNFASYGLVLKTAVFMINPVGFVVLELVRRDLKSRSALSLVPSRNKGAATSESPTPPCAWRLAGYS
jgi:hypothetical protein